MIIIMTNQRGDLLFRVKPGTILRGTERMPQGNERNRRTTKYLPTNPQGEKEHTEKN